MQNLLFEIGVEEMPASSIQPALDQLRTGMARRLKENLLEAESIQSLGTPRRLTVWAGQLPEKQKSKSEQVIGPPAHVAYDDRGEPTGAAVGFARSQGVKMDQLQITETEKGPYVCTNVENPGLPTIELLPGLLAGLVREITFPQSMRWPLPGENNSNDSSKMLFARPIRRLTALLGNKTVPVCLAGLEAGNTIQGHPFLCDADIELRSASLEDYVDKLKNCFVIASYEERRKSIVQQMKGLESQNMRIDMQPDLLEEVAGLVEYPHALIGEFDEDFLHVPECVIVAAMTEHQRYFPVVGEKGRLRNKFAIISNRTEKQADTVREGNERVLRARLADARFFWDEDIQKPLHERKAKLKEVVYLGGLGNNFQRTQRIKKLSAIFAKKMGMNDSSIKDVEEAAELCKADLLTGLVGEFSSLQGHVGRELALNEGKTETVATAIGEHYRPTTSDGPIPESDAGTVLSLADKIDTIVSCYAMGYTADGSQDPFAMRRNAIGILRILDEKKLDLRLGALLESGEKALLDQKVDLQRSELEIDIGETLSFFRDRLYHEAVKRGYRHDMTKAVLSVGFDHAAADAKLNYNIRLFWKRLEALQNCSQKSWWPRLVEVVDRTYRIQKDFERLPPLDKELLQEDAEKLPAELLETNRDAILCLFNAEQFEVAAQKFCEIFAEPVHQFFEEVFVNVEDETLRNTRKTLCGHIYGLFAGYMADLYLIETTE